MKLKFIALLFYLSPLLSFAFEPLKLSGTYISACDSKHISSKGYAQRTAITFTNGAITEQVWQYNDLYCIDQEFRHSGFEVVDHLAGSFTDISCDHFIYFGATMLPLCEFTLKQKEGLNESIDKNVKVCVTVHQSNILSKNEEFLYIGIVEQGKKYCEIDFTLPYVK